MSLAVATTLHHHRAEPTPESPAPKALIRTTDLGQQSHYLAHWEVIEADARTFVESAMPLIEHNLATNKTAYSSVELKAEVLDWEDDVTLLPAKYPNGHDLIMCVPGIAFFVLSRLIPQTCCHS